MLNKTGEYRRVIYKAFQIGVSTLNVIPGLRELPARSEINAQHAEVLFGVVLILVFFTLSFKSHVTLRKQVALVIK